MQKRILLNLLLVFSVLFLAGCGKELIEKETREDIISALEANNLIDDSWECVDVVRQYANVMYLDNDVTGYDYIYLDASEQYHTAEISVKRFNKDDTYFNVEVEIGVEYYIVHIMECDYSVKTKERENGMIITTRNVNHTYDKGYDTYLLHYEASKIMIEKVMNEGDIQ